MTRAALLLSLLLVLSWDAPLTNCDGSPLTDLDHYEVPVFRVVILGWSVCIDGDGNGYACPVYSWSLARHAVPVDVTSLSLADPGVGEVLGYEWPEAFDVAGNSSAECGT